MRDLHLAEGVSEDAIGKSLTDLHGTSDLNVKQRAWRPGQTLENWLSSGRPWEAAGVGHHISLTLGEKTFWPSQTSM